MSNLIKRIATDKGEAQIDYNALANLPKIPTITYGTEDIEVGSDSTAIEGAIHFVYEPPIVTFTINDTSYSVVEGTTWRTAIEDGTISNACYINSADSGGVSPYVCSRGADSLLMNSSGGFCDPEAAISADDYVKDASLLTDIPDTITAYGGYEWDYSNIITCAKGTTWDEYISSNGVPGYFQTISSQEEFDEIANVGGIQGGYEGSGYDGTTIIVTDGSYNYCGLGTDEIIHGHLYF